jgi:hypothetical protein
LQHSRRTNGLTICFFGGIEMKKNFLILLIGILFFACAAGSSRVAERTTQGMIIGAGAGAAIGASTGSSRSAGVGAGIGAIVGGTIGAATGVMEEKAIRHEPPPLPWIEGERVVVYSGRGGYWRDGVRAIIEDGLRGRGAIVVSSAGRRYYYRRNDNVGAVYVAEYDTYYRGNEAAVTIRVIDRTNNEVVAIGEGRYYVYQWNYQWNRRSRNRYNIFANAAKAAVDDLH